MWVRQDKRTVLQRLKEGAPIQTVAPQSDGALEELVALSIELKTFEMLDALAAVGGAATPAERQIAVLAHALWEARGRPAGQPDEDWFRAERALTRQPACVAR